MSSGASNYEYFRYDPSLPAAIIFLICFSSCTIVHGYQMARKRCWFFTPLIVGGFFECIGYVARIACSRQSPHWTLGPYIVQEIFLLLAPALLAASIYMVLAHTIRLVHAEHYSQIPVMWLTKTFVMGDVASFLVQGIGAGLMGGRTLGVIHTGQKVVVVGLFLQLASLAFFIVVALIFRNRMKRSSLKSDATTTVPWRMYLNVLFAASALVMIRSIFRVVEYLEGNSGYLLSHEVFLYLFDSLLMLGVMVLFNVQHLDHSVAVN